MNGLGVTTEPISDEWRQLEHTSAFTWLIDGEIAMCSGIAVLHQGVGEGWALVRRDLKERFPHDWKQLMREGRRFMHSEHMPSLALHRLQIKANTRLSQAVATAQFLGFTKEALLRSYGPNGEDFLIYAIVKDRP